MKPPKVYILRSKKQRAHHAAIKQNIRSCESSMAALQPMNEVNSLAAERINTLRTDLRHLKVLRKGYWEGNRVLVPVRVTPCWVYLGKHGIKIPKGTSRNNTFHLRTALFVYLWTAMGEHLPYLKTIALAEKLTSYWKYHRYE